MVCFGVVCASLKLIGACLLSRAGGVGWSKLNQKKNFFLFLFEVLLLLQGRPARKAKLDSISVHLL